ncbi:MULTISPECIES: sugar kinase [Streptomycetaceae]|uniref:PfkB domain protein n=1 Tax=Streptantibioticus cattleyicolor (strain ATCC 35852 / DSM 46488 / JCM 4925 / NBRC 14057 / NRRL 8057) TaxID=1003195 RepID=F8K2D4_STREN|nr:MULTISPECIES: sugar kinase [Streptomycetaceae]AEW96226.1 PfkB domain protein [Streptantibioticus cattleyicolor NRRL 8057 = DSM 46488]MYS60746.1 sugar kinase [Streptomyces sp. SID5468]CCB76565.1 putative carbohydrate kinase [Streptantibioticus cattleyicolor NRRL 8057 = DSM 46488]
MPTAARFDVVCLGESMVTFVPGRPGRLSEASVFHRGIGGAESNVACYLARTGHRVRWISRVGADGFGDHLVAEIAAAGVDVGAVRQDPARPTGVYFKEPRPEGTAVLYYRAGSAAAAMSRENVDEAAVGSGRLLHLSGITAALSASCRELMTALTRRSPGRPAVSFDVNFRPALWRSRDTGLLAELARGCDIVFVGEDEAAAAWGVRGADAVRAALPEPAVLVVKQGDRGATVYRAGQEGVFAPALAVDVVEPIGAGDAFAAGFLAATLAGRPDAERLRYGHVMAAAALTVAGDLGPPPPGPVADALVALDARAWGRLRLGPGWTGDRAVRQVEVPR